MDTIVLLVTSASRMLERERCNFLPIVRNTLSQIKIKSMSLKLIVKVIPDLTCYLFLYLNREIAI